MAKKVTKQCPSCRQLFVGRRDAKTCSERCRKRLQRATMATAHEAKPTKFTKELGSSRNKICQSCGQVFVGRRAKTCSERCRKRLQRAARALAREA